MQAQQPAQQQQAQGAPQQVAPAQVPFALTPAYNNRAPLNYSECPKQLPTIK